MKKKQFLTESDRKQIILNKEKAILESFAKTFNSIKRIDENELDEVLTKQITTGTGWDAQTKTVKQGNLELNSYAKQLYQLFKKDGANPTLFSGNKGINVQQSENNVVIVVVDNDLMITIQKVGDPMAMANKYGPIIQREFPKLKLTQKPTEIGAEGWGAGPGVEFTFSLENGGVE